MVKQGLVGVVLLIVALATALAAPAAYAQDGSGLASGPDYWPTAGWRTAIPEAQGMSSATLAALIDYVQDEHMSVDSITVIHNGYVVLDVYFHPARQDRRHELFSVTKSFTSTLIGIAIDQGYIAGVDELVLDFFPDRDIANVDADKQAMTVEHLLTMTSGLECDDSQYATLHAMERSRDYVQFALDLPMMEPPGTRFNYCNSVSHLLAAILYETTGQTPREFANDNLFGPLGIERAIWATDPDGLNTGWAQLMLTPRDAAKLGYLFLQDGVWDSVQIVPSAWVQTATQNHNPGVFPGYGYQWWIVSGGYSALGYAGQQINVIPQLDLVVVFTSNMLINTEQQLNTLMLGYIVPSVVSSGPLPENPDAYARLEHAVAAAARPDSPLPEVAAQVSGLTYTLDANPLGWEALALTFEDGAPVALLSVNGGDPAEIGLDGIDRIATPEQLLMPAAFISVRTSGVWDEETFQLTLNGMIPPSGVAFTLTFEDGGVTLAVVDRAADEEYTITGRAG